MKAKQILFNDEMVRAILAGRKMQTRRPITRWAIPGTDNGCSKGYLIVNEKAHTLELKPWTAKLLLELLPAPYIGTLWVREAWAAVSFDKAVVDGHELAYSDSWEGSKTIPAGPSSECTILYRADGEDWGGSVEERGFKWRPSIHMPRWASRITLRVTDLRVERVQGMTPADALAEGIYPIDEDHDVLGSFIDLWDAIYSKRDLGWDANPWAWVVTFEIIK